MYTIKRAAELTGIPAATLRAWERRYGILTPERTGSGYRLYSESSLHTLTLMRDLVEDGWSPRQAAQEIARRLAGASTEDGDEPPQAETAAAPDAGITRPRGRRHAPPSSAVGELVAAAAELDPTRLADLLDDRFSRGSFETVVDGWLMPALAEMGRAWADGRITVAGEHLVSHAVERRLAAAYEAAAHNPVGGPIVVGLPPDAHHELGILAFATAARRAGLKVTYLGADLPAADWPGAAAGQSARYAVLALSRAGDLPALTEVISALRAADPQAGIAVGGRYQHLAPASVRRLGHRIGPAAERLAHDLR
jgi:DNA-binding transcriptional MerR regulator/methylmalonyl-CoA mutase cobalamin-binding subunit